MSKRTKYVTEADTINKVRNIIKEVLKTIPGDKDLLDTAGEKIDDRLYYLECDAYRRLAMLSDEEQVSG